MKRKSVRVKSSEEQYKQTDFYRRFSKTVARGLKDHRYSAEFTLDGAKRYVDDPRQERYEVARAGSEEYLVFLVSIVKVAFAMDEAKYFETVAVNMELRADCLDSFSRIGSFPLSILGNLAMLAVFFGLMWYLFPSLRSTAFVVFQRRPSQEPPGNSQVNPAKKPQKHRK